MDSFEAASFANASPVSQPTQYNNNSCKVQPTWDTTYELDPVAVNVKCYHDIISLILSDPTQNNKIVH